MDNWSIDSSELFDICCFIWIICDDKFTSVVFYLCGVWEGLVNMHVVPSPVLHLAICSHNSIPLVFSDVTTISCIASYVSISFVLGNGYLYAVVWDLSLLCLLILLDFNGIFFPVISQNEILLHSGKTGTAWRMLMWIIVVISCLR